jgi:hypothetical protein
MLEKIKTAAILILFLPFIIFSGVVFYSFALIDWIKGNRI